MNSISHRSHCTLSDTVGECGDRDEIATTVAILCAMVELILASRSDAVAAEALFAHPVPADCISVMHTESGLKVRFIGDSADTAKCHQLTNYIALIAAGLPVQDLAERLEVRVRALSQRCMMGAVALSAKRRRLQVLTRLRVGLLYRQPRSAKLLQKQQRPLAYLLQEPEARIREVWRDHMFWFQFNYAKRLVHLNNRTESADYLDSFEWPGKEEYRRLIQKSGASRVLVTIHMGDFFGAFRVISALADFGRQAISLRRDMTTNHGMQHFSPDRITHHVLYHQQYQATAIVGALRRGHHTLATLFDLRDDFGSTVSVDFFGHRARVVKGPAQLAILGRSHIFPFVCFERGGRNCIEMAPPIDTRPRAGEDLHQATVRITQSMVTLAECWIRRWPGQWKYLPVLPAYFEAAS